MRRTDSSLFRGVAQEEGWLPSILCGASPNIQDMKGEKVMTYSILLVVEKPDMENSRNEQLWHECMNKLENIAKQNIDIEILGENVLLLSLNNTLQGVADVLPRILGLKYKYTVLDQEIQWHEVASEA